jgi:hypothetical protein
MRVRWPAHFPPVYVHTAWQGPHGGLPDHQDYWPAKRHRDAGAAIRLCDTITKEEVLEELYDLGYSEEGSPPIVAAPALVPHDSRNALARGYARWLASELAWEADNGVFQSRTINRGFTTNGWFRILHEPAFYGTVRAGRRYVLADDVCTMGGTLASLRGFIEARGGAVIGMTVLASYDGRHTEISLAPTTLGRLNAHLGGRLASLYEEEVGHGIECVTEQEGQFLLRCQTVNELRAGFDGARNG